MAKTPNKVDPVYFKFDALRINDTKVPLKTYEVSKAAGDAIGIKGIDGSQEIKGLWRIYTTSLENRVKLLSHGMTLRGKRVELLDQNPFVATSRDPDTPAERILISGLSLNVDNQEILDFLRSTHVELTSPVLYGRDRDENGDLTHFRNGQRFVYAKYPIVPVLPRNVSIAGQNVNIFHRSQKEICKCCGQMGHKPKDELCRAYDPDQHVYGFKGYEMHFSNFYKCNEGCVLRSCGHDFNTAEHLYQYTKLVHHEKFDAANKVLGAANGFHAKRIADSILPDEKLSQSWLNIRDQVMKDIVSLKFKACSHARDILVSSHGYHLVEATMDRYWAGGLPYDLIECTSPQYWPGKNKLGEILMEVRYELKEKIDSGETIEPPMVIEEEPTFIDPSLIVFAQTPSQTNSPSRSQSKSRFRSRSRSQSRKRMWSKSRQLSIKMQSFLEKYIKDGTERARKRNASANVNSSQAKKAHAEGNSSQAKKAHSDGNS